MSEEQRRSLRFARRIIIKAGTPVVTHTDDSIAIGRIGNLVEQVAGLRKQGRDVVLVTSGAIGSGASRMRRSMTLSATMHDTVTKGVVPEIEKFAAAAVGQAQLMSMYESMFSKYSLSCAQVLITEADVNERSRCAAVCDTISELLAIGTVPVVNDNDATTERTAAVFDPETSEVRWDNDVLASRIAMEMHTDLLVMLTDMDALYASPRKGEGAEGEAIRLSLYDPEVKLVRSGIKFDMSRHPLLADQARGAFAGRTRLSEEGLQALVSASNEAVAGGVRAAVITTGHHPLSIYMVLRGDDVGTLFIPGLPQQAML